MYKSNQIAFLWFFEEDEEELQKVNNTEKKVTSTKEVKLEEEIKKNNKEKNKNTKNQEEKDPFFKKIFNQETVNTKKISEKDAALPVSWIWNLSFYWIFILALLFTFFISFFRKNIKIK